MMTKIRRIGWWLMARVLLLPLSSFVLLSCTPTPKDVVMQEELPPIYPDYCDVTIPVNIAPLNFLLREDCEAIQISISFPSSGEKEQGRVAKTINTRGNEVVFDLDDWRELMEVSAGKSLDITIAALIKDQWIQYKSFQWHVVSDKVDPYLTYRLIEPDYEIFNHLQIQQRCVENFDVNALGHYEQLENRCMNCHTFANQSPELSMMYVRGPGGGAILNQNGQVEHPRQCLFLFQSQRALHCLLYPEHYPCLP